MPDSTPQKNFVELLKGTQLPELARLFGMSPARLAAVSKVLERLVGFTGMEFGLVAPEAFSGYDPSAWEAFITIEKLKRLGWADYAHPIPRIYPDEPAINAYTVTSKEFAQVSGFNGGGADFFSKENALWAAVGEAVERRALYNYKPAGLDAAYGVVKNRAIDLSTIAGISPALQQQEAYRFDDTSRFLWVEGYSLVQRKKILLPLQLISAAVHKHEGSAYHEPLLRLPVSTGAAAHTDPTQATVTGIRELLERDAFMITWMNMLSPIKIKLDSIPNKNIQTVLGEFKKFNLGVTLLYLPTDFNIHVVLAVVTDSTGAGPALNLGASAGFDLLEVINKALSEVLTSRISVRYLYDGLDGIQRTTTFEHPEQIGRDERLMYWADPRHAHQASFLFAGEERDFSAFPVYPIQDTGHVLQSLIGQFKTKDLELISVSLVEPTIEKELGFTVIQMVAPALQPLHLLERLPYNSGERLETVPRLFGVTPAQEKNTVPHPFP